jgi:hypothetical protein
VEEMSVSSVVERDRWCRGGGGGRRLAGRGGTKVADRWEGRRKRERDSEREEEDEAGL